MAATEDFDALNIEPGIGTRKADNLRVRRVVLGDGLSQRAADGLNSRLENWNVKFDAVSNATAKTILDFFAARGGHEAFLWTPPGESVQKQFTTGPNSIKEVPLIGGQSKTIDVLFIQEFDL